MHHYLEHLYNWRLHWLYKVFLYSLWIWYRMFPHKLSIYTVNKSYYQFLLCFKSRFQCSSVTCQSNWNAFNCASVNNLLQMWFWVVRKQKKTLHVWLNNSTWHCEPCLADWMTTAHDISGARLNLEPMFICLGTVAVIYAADWRTSRYLVRLGC